MTAANVNPDTEITAMNACNIVAFCSVLFRTNGPNPCRCFPYRHAGDEKRHAGRTGYLESSGPPEHEWQDRECKDVFLDAEARPAVENHQTGDYDRREQGHEFRHMTCLGNSLLPEQGESERTDD